MIRPVPVISKLQTSPNHVMRLSISASVPCGMSPRSARNRNTWWSDTPTWPISSGRSNNVRNWRFQQVSRKSRSNTVTPSSIWSSAVCSRSAILLQRFGSVIQQAVGFA